MALYHQLRNQISKFSDSDPDWVQFVHDHYDWIRRRATEVRVDPEDAFHDRYRPETLLSGRLGVPSEIIWIVLLINGITSESDIRDLRKLLVITDLQPIETLYMSYTTWTTNLETHRARLAE